MHNGEIEGGESLRRNQRYTYYFGLHRKVNRIRQMAFDGYGFQAVLDMHFMELREVSGRWLYYLGTNRFQTTNSYT